MKKLTIVTTYGTKYWPLPVQKGLKTIEQFWPEHEEGTGLPRRHVTADAVA